MNVHDFLTVTRDLPALRLVAGQTVTLVDDPRPVGTLLVEAVIDDDDVVLEVPADALAWYAPGVPAADSRAA